MADNQRGSSERWVSITIIYVIATLALSFIGWKVLTFVADEQVVPWSLTLSPNQILERKGEIRSSVIQTVTAAAQTFGGAALVIGLLFSWRNMQITENNLRATQELTQEAQITERFGRAIEQLGSERLEIRVGGIYALERIARDSARDHWAIVEVLTAFVRESSKDRIVVNAMDAAADVQAAITVLGRRTRTEQRERGVLDLHGSRLDFVNMEDADFCGALFVNASFKNAFLRGTKFCGASLMNVDFEGAVIDGANFDRAVLTGTRNLERNV